MLNIICKKLFKNYNVFLQFDGVRVVSTSEDLTTRVRNLKSGFCEQIIKNNTVSLVLKSSDNILMQGLHDGVVKIWDVVNKCCLHTLDGENMHTLPVTGVYLKYNFIVTSGEDGFVKLWEFSTG